MSEVADKEQDGHDTLFLLDEGRDYVCGITSYMSLRPTAAQFIATAL